MAYSGVFITHGGFEIVRDAWLYVSNLIASQDYRTAVTAIFVTSIVLGATVGPWRYFLQASSYYGWMLSGIGALLMYATMFQTGIGTWNLSGKIVVRDDVLNKSQTIQNLPAGLVAMATALNRAQTGMESLILSTAAGPYMQDSSEVAVATKMLREATTGRLLGTVFAIIPVQVKRSLWSYIEKDLSYVASAEPAVDEALSKTDSMITAYEMGANPAILDVLTWLDSGGNPQNFSEVVDGAEAWRRLKLYLTTKWPDVMRRFCIQFGFDASGASINTCKQILSSSLDSFLVPGKTADDFTKDILLGAMWNKYLERLDSTIALSAILSAQRTQSSLMSAGISAEQWIPHLKIVITALVIGVTPVVLLFAASTFYFSAARLLLSLYLWLLMWAVMDKTAEAFWISYSQHLWDAIKWSAGSGIGVGALGHDMFWSVASQSLAVLGGMRSAGMMLAGVITYGIFGFGGSMLAHLAGTVSASVQSGISEGSGAVHPSYSAQRQVAESAASSMEASGMLANMTMGDWYYKGLLSARKVQSDATGMLTQQDARAVAYQRLRETLAHAYTTEVVSNHGLVQREVQKFASELGSAAVREMAEKRYGIQNPALANQIIQGKVPVGNAPLEAKEKMLNDVFGKDFSSYLRSFAQKNKISYQKLISSFDNLKVTGVPGQMINASGIVEKKGLEALAGYSREKLGSTNFAQGLVDAAQKTGKAEINATGFYGGPAHISLQAGNEARTLDLVHQKIEGEQVFSWDQVQKNPVLKDALAEIEQQAWKNHWRPAVAMIEWMKAHPDKPVSWAWKQDTSGRISALYAKRGAETEWQELTRAVGTHTFSLAGKKVFDNVSGWWEDKGGKITGEFVVNALHLKRSTGKAPSLYKYFRDRGDMEKARMIENLPNADTYTVRITADRKTGDITELVVGNRVIIGKERSVVDKETIDTHALNIKAGTWWDIFSGDKEAAMFVARRLLSPDYSLDTAKAVQMAYQGAEAMKMIRSYSGKTISRTAATGDGSISLRKSGRMPGIIPVLGGVEGRVRVKGGLGVEAQSMEERVVNLDTARILRAEYNAWQEALRAVYGPEGQREIRKLVNRIASEKGIVGDEMEKLEEQITKQKLVDAFSEKFAEHIARAGSYASQELDRVKKATASDYGASALLTLPAREIKEIIDKTTHAVKAWWEGADLNKLSNVLGADEETTKRFVEALRKNNGHIDLIEAYRILHGQKERPN